MTHDELVANLGTIAHSGSGEFLKALASAKSDKEKSDLSLIGQFGVGFYAAFMIADRVRVRTRELCRRIGLGMGVGRDRHVHHHARRRKAAARHRGDPSSQGRRQGLRVALADQGDRPALSRASFPIRSGWGPSGEVINDQKPIWVEPKSQVTEEQYIRFYQHLTHHPEEKPLWHLHMAADSPIQFRAIVYCPPTNLENLGFARLEHGLNLCAKRVLVQSDCRELVPEYLRFLRGLVDSEDLPLNVSRETLAGQQRHPQDPHVAGQGRSRPPRSPRPGRRRQVPDVLRPVRPDPQGGPGRRSGQQGADRQAAALRVVAERRPVGARVVRRVLARMPEGQSRIYYLGGTDLSSIAKSPNLEIFRRKGLEVLVPDRSDRRVRPQLAAFVPGQGPDLDRLGRPRSARYRTDDRAGARARARARPRRAASTACSSCSGPRSGIGSARSASRSG